MKYAALYCRTDSAYKNRPDWDVYDKTRDARTYIGTNPVVCHPPCRAWSQLQHRSFRSEENPGYERATEMQHALYSMGLVYSNGGILEHPKSSRLWKIGNTQQGLLLNINQYDFGHVASKPTTLFIYPKITIPPLPMPKTNRPPKDLQGRISRCTQYEREYTPEKLIDFFEQILDRITALKNGIGNEPQPS